MIEHFEVDLLPSDGLRVSVDFGQNEKLDCHETIIRPLVYNSIETLVYGLDNNSQLLKDHQEILMRYKGKYKLDLDREGIDGHESLWNSKAWKRGSIVIIIEPNDISLRDIIKQCFKPAISATPRSGNSNSAINYCRNKAKEGLFAFCLSASNGIESMLIYGPQEELYDLYEFALENSKEADYWEKRTALLKSYEEDSY